VRARFAKLNIGAGKTFDAQALSPELRKAVEDGVADAWKTLDGQKELIAAGRISTSLAGTRAYNGTPQTMSRNRFTLWPR
jgi:hypothetical protein